MDNSSAVQKSLFGKMTFLILLTNIIPPLAIDEYTPSMPHMVSALGTNVSLMQLSITFYMFAFAISQIIGGFLSDHYGRRSPLLYSVPLFFIGSLICISTDNITGLIIGRLVQGFGVGILALTGPALMADYFKGNDLNRVSSYYSTIYSFIPISAPILGGFIQDYLDWRANFGFMLVVSIFIYFLFVIYLPETSKPIAKKSFSIKMIAMDYLAVLGHRDYMLSVICMILIWSMFVVFSLMAPFIIQDCLGFSASQYGLQALFIGLGFFVGNNINNLLLKKYAASTISKVSLIIMVLLSLMLLLLAFKISSVWAITMPLFFMMCSAGAVFPNLYASAVSAVPEHAGVAGALIGSLILIGAVIITSLLTRLHAHSLISMASVYCVLTLACLIIYHLKQTKNFAFI